MSLDLTRLASTFMFSLPANATKIDYKWSDLGMLTLLIVSKYPVALLHQLNSWEIRCSNPVYIYMWLSGCAKVDIPSTSSSVAAK
jgi:hypothetical protein